MSGAGCSHEAVSTTYVDGVRLCRLCGVPVLVVPVGNLADLAAGTREEVPYVAGDTVGRYCGKAGRVVMVTVNPLNWGTPERLAAYCETRACSCSMKVSDLPVRYRVTRDQFRKAAADAVLAALAPTSEAEEATPSYPAGHGWTPATGPFAGPDPSCRVMLARHVCNWSREEHDPDLPPVDVDVFGYRRGRFAPTSEGDRRDG